MATKKDPAAAADTASVNSPDDPVQGATSINAAPEPATPENTPPPGGGSWRWDITKPGWVRPNAAPDAAADTPAA